MSESEPESKPEPKALVSVTMDDQAAQAVEAVLSKGDISKLTLPERSAFLINMAKSLGLNPLSRPVDLIPTKDGRLIPYFNKGATDQLRGLHKVNIEVLERWFVEPDIYAVRVKATLPSGRVDESMATVFMKGLVGDDRANAFMKAETKAKRRVTLSALGLNFLDELEVQAIPAFQQQTQVGPRRLDPGPTLVRVTPTELVDETTGEVIEEAVEVKPVVTPTVTTNPARKLPVVPPIAVKK